MHFSGVQHRLMSNKSKGKSQMKEEKKNKMSGDGYGKGKVLLGKQQNKRIK